MTNHLLSRRTFLKGIGFLALLGLFAPWIRKNLISNLPIEVRKEPKAIPRGEI